MKISTKGIYGMMAMIEVAQGFPDETVALSTVSEKHGISENYLEQIFSVLRRKGIVESVRGAYGGYRLADEPGKITAGAVLKVLEGSLMPVACEDNIDSGKCKISDICVTRMVWSKIGNAAERVAESVTLEELVCEYNRKNESQENMYYI